jgi:hypothetical protein
VEAVVGEIAAINGEYFAEAFTFGDAEEGRVAEIHGTVRVFAHQFADSGNVCGIERELEEGAALDHFPQRLLGGGLIGEQVHGFDERGPDGGKRLAQRFESGNAAGVVLVIGIDDGDERPGVDENQARRLRSAAKRRPVRSERLEFPPWTTPTRSAIAA